MTTSPQPVPTRRGLGPKLLLLAVSSTATLTGAEVLSRWRAHLRNRDTLSGALERPVVLAPGESATLADIIQPSPDDRIAYELRPGQVDVPFKGAGLTTNSRGFRSPDYPMARGPRTITILGLGDSIMFGHGVGDDEGYLEQLRARLVALHPDRDWRVINTAVPGYNTVMEVETLVTKGLVFEPDLVILGIVGNDYAPPVYVRTEEDVLDPTRSFFLDFLREKLAGQRLSTLEHMTSWRQRTGQSDGSAPPRYSDLYGEQPFEQALDRLAALAREHDFGVIAFAQNDYPEVPAMMESCGRRGFQLVHMQPELEAFIQEQTGQPFDWELYARSALPVSPDNLHPSPLQHRMAADLLLAALQEGGLLDRWLTPR